VLPSDYEPFGVVVNEAILCGCVVVVSDKVGAGGDLVTDGETGLVYPAGDVHGLANAMMRLAVDLEYRERLRTSGAGRISEWSPALSIDRLVAAVDLAARRPE
jgi:glycosyltransferase involved in cell wall biosynthesis